VVIRKPGKPDYHDAGAYRPISLLPTLAKLLEGLVAARILVAAETHKILPTGHWGGRPHRSTGDALTRIAQFIKDAMTRGDAVALLALDVEGAYNCVKPRALTRELAATGNPACVTQWCESFCSGRQESLRIGGSAGLPYAVNDGLPQGSPISQLLWLIYSGKLVGDHSTGSKISRQLSIGWVDDWTLVVRGPSPLQAVAAAQQRVDNALQWAARYGARFDPAKAGFLLFSKRAADPSAFAIRLGKHRIQAGSELTILGLTFQSDLRWTKHAAKVTGKATRALSGLLHWGNRAWGFSYHSTRLLYTAGVLPIITYAIEAWLPLAGFRGVKGALSSFASLQRAAGLRITGALRSTSTEALDAEADLLPIHLQCAQAQAYAAVRWLTLPTTHPLAAVVDQRLRVQRKNQPGPIDMALRAYQLRGAAIKRRLFAPAALCHPPKCFAARQQGRGLYRARYRCGLVQRHPFLH
jgi:hypothetical protein